MSIPVGLVSGVVQFLQRRVAGILEPDVRMGLRVPPLYRLALNPSVFNMTLYSVLIHGFLTLALPLMAPRPETN